MIQVIYIYSSSSSSSLVVFLLRSRPGFSCYNVYEIPLFDDEKQKNRLNKISRDIYQFLLLMII